MTESIIELSFKKDGAKRWNSYLVGFLAWFRFKVKENSIAYAKYGDYFNSVADGYYFKLYFRKDFKGEYHVAFPSEMELLNKGDSNEYKT